MITIQIGGQVFENFKNAAVVRSVETLSGGFSFTATAKNGVLYPIRAGQECKVFVNGVQQIQGFVDAVDVSYDNESHEIYIEGRDKTQDLIDSTIGPNVDLKGPITLENIIKTTLSKMGLSGISVINKVTDLKIFSAQDIASADIDISGFAFLESYAKQRQVFLTGDGKGNIVITRAGTERATTGLQNIVEENTQNNIKSASAKNDISKRFNLYDVSSTLTPALFETDIDNDSIANQNGSATDTAIRASRKLFFQSEESDDGNTAKERSQWEANIRRAKSKSYSALVQGFAQEDGALWQPNTLVNVSDDFANVKAQMLVWSVKFSYSTQNGSTTELACVPPDALSLLSSEPTKQKKTDEIGDIFSITDAEAEATTQE